jgi:hypothetical protein
MVHSKVGYWPYPQTLDSAGQVGATTHSITTFSITTFNITALNTMGLFVTLSISDTQLRRTVHYDECHVFYCYAECHYASIVMLRVVAAERPARDKYSSLLRKLVNYRSKKSCNIGPKSLRL